MPNQKQDKTFISNAVAIFLNRFFHNIAALLVMYFYAHHLTKNEYGQYQSFWAQLNIFNAIAGLGISLFVFTYKPSQLIKLFKRIKRKYYLYYFLFLISCGLLLAYMQLVNHVSFPLVILFLMAFALSNISDALMIVFKRMKILIMINITYAVLFFMAHYYYLNDFDLNDLLLILLPIHFLKLIISAFVLFKSHKKLSIKEENTPISKFSLKKMRSFWIHMYIYDMIQVSFIWIDKFIISILLTNEETATYVNGALNIPFLPIVFSAVSSAALIHLSQHSNKEIQLKTVNNIGMLLSCIAFPLFMLLFFFKQEFIIFFFSDKYLESIPIFVCSIFILPLRAYGFTVLLQHHEQGKIINLGAAADLILAILLMYPMYLWIGLPGVALSLVISTFIQSIVYLTFTKRLINTTVKKLLPINNYIFKFVGFGLLSGLLYYGLDNYLTAQQKLFLAAFVIGLIAFVVFIIELKKIKKQSINLH